MSVLLRFDLIVVASIAPDLITSVWLLILFFTIYHINYISSICTCFTVRGSAPHVCLSTLQVIWCFLYSLYTQLYVSGAVVALFVEVNSVTLHLRLMLKLAGAQSSTFYQINKFANFLTYVSFRLSTQFYLTWYILNNYSWLEHSAYFLVSLMVMNIMILIYFYRLLRADFFSQRKSSEKQNGTHSSRKFLSDWLRQVNGLLWFF